MRRRQSGRLRFAALAMGWALVSAGLGAPRVCAAPAAHGADAAQAERGRSTGRAVQTSRLKAIGASLLLPGLGQRMTGHGDRARVFFAIEGGILATYAAFTVQGHVRREGYIDYAELFAGVSDARDRPDWYYRNLAAYIDSDAYVDDLERTARAMYGEDLEARRQYVERNRPRPDEVWQWRAESDRQEFRSRRNASRNSFRSASHMVGAALLNRLLSAVDAAILASRGSRPVVYYDPRGEGSGYLCIGWSPD